ncbi:MAG: hypothetical protein JRD04_00605 [Deltaproteobacteria bacterium]|nr:hypothetical protein [Deltaproteobacteria bacterium]
MRKVWTLRVVSVFFVMFLFVSSSVAMEYDVGGKKLYILGSMEQYARFGGHGTNYNPTGDYATGGAYKGLMGSFYSLNTRQHLIWSDNLEFRTAFRLEGDYAVYEVNKDSSDWAELKESKHNMEIDDDFDEILRECNVGYFSRKLNLRIGKQTVAWGQTDLFRLMDMINPIDYRRMYILRDSDYGYQESRVPTWIAKVEYFPEVSVGPVSGIGLEFIWTPETESRTLFNIGPRNGGVWAFPVPYDMPPGLRDLNIYDRRKARNFENSTLAFRFKGNWGNTFLTLNAFYGWSDMPVLTRSRDNPGMIYGVANGGNIGDGPGYGLDLDMVYHRKPVLGFTVSREMDFIRPLVQAIGQVANPTFRIESYYRFNKPFSTDWIERIKSGAASPADSGVEFEKRDVLRYMVGFDWPLRVSWLNSRKQFFTSFQFLHAHTIHSGDFWEAPYHCKSPGISMILPA